MLFRKGKSEAEDETHGVSVAVRSKLLKDILSLPLGIKEHYMKFWFPLKRSCNVAIISAYTPTLISPDDVKECF